MIYSEEELRAVADLAMSKGIYIISDEIYEKLMVDMEVLEKYSEGLIAMSACLSGDIPKAILNNNYEKAKELALKLNSIFGQDNFILSFR